MEAAIQTVVKVFLKSAKGKESLGGKNFQGLVKSQLSNILSDTESSAAVKEMREGLDANQDGKVSFEEYMKLVGYLATSLSQQRTVANEDVAQKTETKAAESAPAPEKEDGKAEEKTGAKAEEATQPEAVKEEEKPAAAAAAAVEVKEEVAEAEKVEEPEEKPAAAAEEEVEKKTEEEAS
ncbi:S100 calcium binding protein U [Polymixia lowei]